MPGSYEKSGLAANVSDCKNVTLVNAALSNSSSEVGFTVPSGNFYQAKINAGGDLKVASIGPAILNFDHKINFIKLDAEGHEEIILNSLGSLLNSHRPRLMVENNTAFLEGWADKNSYRFSDFVGSHNHILVPKELY